MRRYEFSAFVWTDAETEKEARDNLSELLGVVRFTSCGLSIDESSPVVVSFLDDEGEDGE